MAIQGLLDEPRKVRILARQIVNPSCSDNLTGVENSVDYEQCVHYYSSFFGHSYPLKN